MKSARAQCAVQVCTTVGAASVVHLRCCLMTRGRSAEVHLTVHAGWHACLGHISGPISELAAAAPAKLMLPGDEAGAATYCPLHAGDGAGYSPRGSPPAGAAEVPACRAACDSQGLMHFLHRAQPRTTSG